MPPKKDPPTAPVARQLTMKDFLTRSQPLPLKRSNTTDHTGLPLFSKRPAVARTSTKDDVLEEIIDRDEEKAGETKSTPPQTPPLVDKDLSNPGDLDCTAHQEVERSGDSYEPSSPRNQHKTAATEQQHTELVTPQEEKSKDRPEKPTTPEESGLRKSTRHKEKTEEMKEIGIDVESKIRGCTAKSIKVVREKEITSTKYSAKRVIRICQGDLTREITDCIVNPANGQLAHGGGLAYAISAGAGAALDKESRDYIKKNGPLATGEATFTTSGRLPCKFVIHAVGPIYRNGKQKESQLLRDSCRNSLKIADSQKAFSIAIPAISSGIFGFPKDLCAQILVDSVLKWFQQNPNTSVSVVHLTNIDEITVSHMRDAFDAIFPE